MFYFLVQWKQKKFQKNPLSSVYQHTVRHLIFTTHTWSTFTWNTLALITSNFVQICICALLILLLWNLSLWVCYSKGHPVFKQTIPKDRVKGSCLLSEMIPLQLVGKVPGKDIPIVLWDNKVGVIEYIRLQSFML